MREMRKKGTQVCMVVVESSQKRRECYRIDVSQLDNLIKYRRSAAEGSLDEVKQKIDSRRARNFAIRQLEELDRLCMLKEAINDANLKEAIINDVADSEVPY